MGETWYQGRMSQRTGFESREVRLTLSPDDWATFDAIARSREWGRSKTASYMVSGYALLVRTRATEQRPRVYYDAQGREHEEGDVR